jgi:hypothetical protein
MAVEADLVSAMHLGDKMHEDLAIGVVFVNGALAIAARANVIHCAGSWSRGRRAMTAVNQILRHGESGRIVSSSRR